MPIPDFQTLMLPVLAHVGEMQSRTTTIVSAMADHFGLSDSERAEMLPSGRQIVIANRVHWALSYLGRAGLLDRVARGVLSRLGGGAGGACQSAGTNHRRFPSALSRVQDPSAE